MSKSLFDAVQEACDETVDALAACRTVVSDAYAQQRLDVFGTELYDQMERAEVYLREALDSLNFVALNVEEPAA